MEKVYNEGACCKFVGVFGKIYTLSDENGNVFYVGCTLYPLESRLKSHLSQARVNGSVNKRKNELIKSLDFKVIATIVEMKWITGTAIKNMRHKILPLEREWISKYRNLGYQLVNKNRCTYKSKPIIKEHVGMSVGPLTLQT